MKIGSIDSLIIHGVGNKTLGDGVKYSNKLANIDKTEQQLKELLNLNFQTEEAFHFYFIPTLDLNPVYQFVSSIFNKENSIIEQSKNIARFLYDNSTHPKIKKGELCISLIRNCIYDNKTLDAICLFKSENKETFLKLNTNENGYDITNEKGIGISKLDKGCFIFNTQKDTGYIVYIVDNTNKSSEAQYWRNNFLGVQPIKNSFHKTREFLNLTKEIITKNIELPKTDKIDILNKSANYFKENSEFNRTDFEKKVLSDQKLIDVFQKFGDKFREDNEIEINNKFEISKDAVKKQIKTFRSILKLDKNFHIYIHGNKDLIEKGTDNNGRKFYKIYYDEEN